MVEYIERARNFYGQIVIISGSTEKANKEIKDFKDGKTKYPEFKKRFGLTGTKAYTLGRIRWVQNYLPDSKNPFEAERGEELRETLGLVRKRPITIEVDYYEEEIREPTSKWEREMLSRYKSEFPNQDYPNPEKILNLPIKPYCQVGFYEHVPSISFEELMDNYNHYLRNVGNIILSLQKYFGSVFCNETYTRNSKFPIVLRFRVFYVDSSGNEYCFQSGYIRWEDYYQHIINLINKYFKFAIEDQDYYEDNPNDWIIKYFCVDTMMYSKTNFNLERGKRDGIYLNYL